MTPRWIQPVVEYVPDESDELWWCNTHNRTAKYLRRRSFVSGKTDEVHTCNPKLGGIMLPCSCVNLTGIAEIEECQ